MTVVQLGRTKTVRSSGVPDAPFTRKIWITSFSVDATIAATFPGVVPETTGVVTIIGIRDSNGAVYSEKSSAADCRDEEQSYYYDGAVLYVHLVHETDPFSVTLFYGAADYYSSKKVVSVGGVQYLPLLKSFPKIKKQQDILNYGSLSFITGTVKLDNSGGRLDDLKDNVVFGNELRQFYLPDHSSDDYETTELVPIASYYVQDYDIGISEVSLRIQDQRKSQEAVIPSDRFTATEYSDIGRRAGEVIPVLWGEATEIPAIITNEGATSGDVTYRAAITMSDFGTVYVADGDGGWTVATPTSSTLSTGDFTLAAADARDGTTPRPAKLVGCEGIEIDSFADIIVDANERFLDIEYSDSNYDTAEWTTEAANIGTGGYYLASEKKLHEVISDIQNGADVGFRYDILPSGRRTIRVDNEGRAAVDEIDSISIANRNDITVKTDSSTLASEIVVEHSRSYVDDSVLRVTDDDNLQFAIDTYGVFPRKTFASYLVSSADAADKASWLAGRFGEIRGQVEVTLLGADFLNLRIYDMIYIELTPDEITQQNRPFYGWLLCKILSVEPDTDAVSNRISAVVVRDFGASIWSVGDAFSDSYDYILDCGGATSATPDLTLIVGGA
jgi:hypothetical protein